ncbi:ribose 1,5-bisphosphokinase [Motiliproteus sediminis]|uniref:ribose 1,5-bisphosphokinase n=1 Tax=Motiliproteus sediminis TaxID=1468178 RepID=UPI001AEF66DC|nr:ribose 1,5-bisphosphokinase [Motiliproteus sediminis]
MSVTESRVFYLMGASGSGKDSLLRGCRRIFTEADRCFVAHRYITREPELAGENHIWLSEQEFAKRQQLGAFAMHWQAHGRRYGVGAEINHWLDQGISVLVNGSRSYLPSAQALYHHRLVPVMIEVDDDTLRQRLLLRGREDAAEVERRIRRAREQAVPLGKRMLRVDNSADLEAGVDALVRVIRGYGIASDLPDRAYGGDC